MPFKMLCKAGEGVTSAFYQNGVKQSRSTCCLKQLLRKNHKVFHRTIFKTATKGRTFSLERMRDHWEEQIGVRQLPQLTACCEFPNQVWKRRTDEVSREIKGTRVPRAGYQRGERRELHAETAKQREMKEEPCRDSAFQPILEETAAAKGDNILEDRRTNTQHTPLPRIAAVPTSQSRKTPNSRSSR